MSRRLSQPADLGAFMGSADALAQAFVSLSSDIALVINELGVITCVVQDEQAPMAPHAQQWVGQRWIETVTGETRRKVELLLADVGHSGLARKRQVNHGKSGDADIPVAYTAMRLGAHGPVLAVGRDLRTVAAIQQRFQDTQQELERTYWRARQTEARYRLLFQVATDAVFVVDGQTLRVLEGNAAALALLRSESGPLAGRMAEHQFDASSRPALRSLLAKASNSGQGGEVYARLAGTHIPMAVAATAFRVDDAGHAQVRVLLRVRAGEHAAADTTTLGTPLARLVDTTAEGIVVTDSAGHVVVANQAFVQLSQAAGAEQVQGQPLASWLGQNADVLPQLMARVRQRGLTQMLGCHLRREGATALAVDATVTSLTEGDQERFGFTLRPCVALPAETAAPLSAQTLALAQGIQALCADVGSAPLGSLLQRAEHMARGHLVRQALHRGAGSDEAAARELGISLAELTRLRREHACEDTAPLR